MKFLSIILLSTALLLEITLTTIPLVLISLICLTIIYKEEVLFVLAFIFGVFLDLALFRTIGLSSLFFVIFLFLILIYQRKFEIKTVSFLLVATVLGNFIYLWIFSYHNLIVLQTIASAIIGLIIFSFLKKINNKKISNF